MWVLLVALNLVASAQPDFDRLPLANTSQLVWVKPTGGVQTELEIYEKQNGQWHKVNHWPVVIGRSGFATAIDKKEGDGKTPQGLYDLGQAMGIAGHFPTAMNYIKILPEDKWIDDPKSPDYNKWIRGNTLAESYETLLRADGLYDLLVVVNYNMNPVVPYKGSAIFVHIWQSRYLGTAGCVAMSEGNIERLLRWLKASAQPKILLANP